MKPSVKNKASIVAVMGATGSGKSAFVKQLLAERNPNRLLIWDTMREYGSFGPVYENMGGIVEHMAKAKYFNLVFSPSRNDKTRAKQFDLFCKLAMTAGDLTLLVEELKFVTKPSWSPLPWSEVNLTGRHKKLMVIGTSQRPAHIDKDFLSNATIIHTGMLGEERDMKPVAAAMRIAVEEIAVLKPLEWIEKDRPTGKITKGKLTF